MEDFTNAFDSISGRTLHSSHTFVASVSVMHAQAITTLAVTTELEKNKELKIRVIIKKVSGFAA